MTRVLSFCTHFPLQILREAEKKELVLRCGKHFLMVAITTLTLS